jgi:5'-nucleotidase
MKILVSNDDGYLATGINVLADALADIAEVVVVAPDRNRSAASNSLTLQDPLRISKVAQNRYRVNGTPSDCVHLALTGFLDEEPDLVVSGINHGANLGDDVIYSGTVAAAMEGRFLGYPSIAVSLVGHRLTHFDTAARVAKELVQRLERNPLPKEFIFNVNVPDRPYEELSGIGRRGWAFVTSRSPWSGRRTRTAARSTGSGRPATARTRVRARTFMPSSRGLRPSRR